MSLHSKGRIKSEQERKNISNALKGRKLPREWVVKIIESRKWYKHSEQTKDRISKGNKGKKRTEECKIANSIQKLGMKHSEKSKKKISANSAFSKSVLQYSLNNEFIAEYPSKATACRALGLNSPRIKDCCLGINGVKQIAGYIWKYKN